MVYAACREYANFVCVCVCVCVCQRQKIFQARIFVRLFPPSPIALYIKDLFESVKFFHASRRKIS